MLEVIEHEASLQTLIQKSYKYLIFDFVLGMLDPKDLIRR